MFYPLHIVLQLMRPRLQYKYRTSHIHSCRQREALLTSQWSQYCYKCFEWFLNKSDWKKYSEWHLYNLSMRYDIHVSRWYLISPGTCPFCLGDRCLAADERTYQWTVVSRLWTHIEGHLNGLSWPIDCPHPLYMKELKNVEDFNLHMIDVHGRGFSTRRFSGKADTEETVMKMGPRLRSRRPTPL